MLTVGQACEVAWREAVSNAFAAERERIFRTESDLQSLWEDVQQVPRLRRSQWHDSEDAELHLADVKTELLALNGTPDSRDAPLRSIHIIAKPPRGVRKRIIASVAARFGVTESATDNLWQAYRRFERETREPPDSAET